MKITSSVFRSSQWNLYRADLHPGKWLKGLARMGYAVKGAVYSIIGLLAFKVAVGGGGKTTDSHGVIHGIAHQPFGKWLLCFTAVGFLGYALWRLCQAIYDPDQRGSDGKGYVIRFGYVISAVAHLLLAVSAGGIVLGYAMGSGDSKGWTAKIMALPLGQWIVGAIGIAIIGTGIGQFVKAYREKFMDELQVGTMRARQKRWSLRLGQAGLTARGIVFVLIGIFLVQAAVHARPGEARGLSGALRAVASQAYGQWLLGIVSVGLVAYALHCFNESWYRRVDL